MNGTLEEWRARATEAERKLAKVEAERNVAILAMERYRTERDTLVKALSWAQDIIKTALD